MNAEKPTVLIVAGPNGAGKSTLAPVFLRETLSIRNYVNADTIAKGLSAFASEEQAFRAGRIMLARLRDFAAEGRSFAFESTLATRSYAPWLRRLAAGGYHVKVVFLSLRSADLAVARVQARVRAGGHDVGMKTNGYREILVAPHLAYRDKGVPGIVPENAMLRIRLWVRSVQTAT